MSKNQRWASDDDANDLLAGILDETEQDAKAEEQRIQAEIQAREAEERRKKEAEEDKKRREAEARISAELERQNSVQERRTARMEALKIEDLKAKGEWVDPAILAAKQAEEFARERAAQDEKIRRDAVAAAAVQAAASDIPMPANTNTSNGKLYAVLGLVAALVVIGGGVLFAMSQGYKADQTQYSKTVFKPKDVAVALVEKSFTPIPKAVEAPPEEEDTKSIRRSSSSRRSSPKATSKPAAKASPKTDAVGKEANKKANALEEMLKSSGGDPFGL